MPHSEPFALLQSLEQAVLQGGLPVVPVSASARWLGIGFRLGTHHFLAPLGEVREVLLCPPLTRIPGTKPWVKGLGNVRGQLVPVVDLGTFFQGVPVQQTRTSRLIGVNHPELTMGLLVDAVVGRQSFFQQDQLAPPAATGVLADCLQGSFHRGEREWGILSLHGLLRHPAFLQVAA